MQLVTQGQGFAKTFKKFREQLFREKKNSAKTKSFVAATNNCANSLLEMRQIFKVIFFKRIYLSIQAELTKTTPYIYKKQLKLFIKTRNVNFKLIIRCENQFLMILAFIFEHIPIFKQLSHFSSCRVFETYPGFETITGTHINVKEMSFCRKL